MPGCARFFYECFRAAGEGSHMKAKADPFLKFQALMVVGAFVWLVYMNRQPGPPQEFSPDGKVKVLMPGKPEAVDGGNRWCVETWDWCCGVAFYDLPHEGSVDPETILDTTLKGITSDHNARIWNVTKITLAGRFPGRAFEAYEAADNAFIMGRAYVVEDRFYLVFASSSKRSKLDSADVTKVLESLEVISGQ
jgi:hypothetical protein